MPFLFFDVLSVVCRNTDSAQSSLRYNGWPAIRVAILVCEKDCINGQLDYQFKQTASSTTQGPSLKPKWGEGTYILDRGEYCASEGGLCVCGGWISYGRDDNWVTSPTKASMTRLVQISFTVVKFFSDHSFPSGVARTTSGMLQMGLSVIAEREGCVSNPVKALTSMKRRASSRRNFLSW